MKSKGEIEIIAENFVEEYFMRNHIGDWRDIYSYRGDWSAIFKEVQEILGLSYKLKVELINELLELEKEIG